jgi:membrane-associated HD superfamily phosphohydrolase
MSLLSLKSLVLLLTMQLMFLLPVRLHGSLLWLWTKFLLSLLLLCTLLLLMLMLSMASHQYQHLLVVSALAAVLLLLAPLLLFTFLLILDFTGSGIPAVVGSPDKIVDSCAVINPAVADVCTALEVPESLLRLETVQYCCCL